MYQHTLILWSPRQIRAQRLADGDSHLSLRAAVTISLSPDRQSLACVRPLGLSGKTKAAVKRLSEREDGAARCPSCFRSRVLKANHLFEMAQRWLLVSCWSTLWHLLHSFFSHLFKYYFSSIHTLWKWNKRLAICAQWLGVFFTITMATDCERRGSAH